MPKCLKCAKVERQSQSVDLFVGRGEDSQNLATFIIIGRDFLPWQHVTVTDHFLLIGQLWQIPHSGSEQSLKTGPRCG